jgi:hypothetical protein
VIQRPNERSSIVRLPLGITKANGRFPPIRDVRGNRRRAIGAPRPHAKTARPLVENCFARGAKIKRTVRKQNQSKKVTRRCSDFLSQGNEIEVSLGCAPQSREVPETQMSIQMLVIFQGLILISAANMAPVVCKRLWGTRFAGAIDGGWFCAMAIPCSALPRRGGASSPLLFWRVAPQSSSAFRHKSERLPPRSLWSAIASRPSSNGE